MELGKRQLNRWNYSIFGANDNRSYRALTLPSAFAKTGWLLGLVLITILAFISYMTVTFVIETMACANAIYYWGRLEQLKREREHEGVSY